MDALNELRKEIDKCDKNIVDILAYRMVLVQKIGYYKKKNNINIKQLLRWNKLLYKQLKEAEKNGIGKDCMFKIYIAIHQEALKQQYKICGRQGNIDNKINSKVNKRLIYFISLIEKIYKFLKNKYEPKY